ncbi:hypothetical protein Gocc_2886 [Gaiella occulta]|uniref:Uncharacterized protein n=1 Tax=Gaiella occulta TaxID=1002870 RepID=A0A7M2YT79_9ACTN|nr:hypothetical protein [Gaiella occulta]RDI73286.1 hypothetical protein Gocc_2886 [Gaiella occulta]
MRVEVGAPVVVVAGVDALWHIPTASDGATALCGLAGDEFVFAGVIRRRRLCGVCRARHSGDHYIAEVGPLPARHGRRGGRPKGVYAKVTEPQLRALHHLYVTEVVSVRELGRRYWQRLGYASAAAAATSLDGLFRDRGLPLRSRSEALAIRNTKHGRRRRALGETGEAVAAYRRWLKETEGRYRPACKGVSTQAPRKGSPCQKPAMAGSDYCFNHDPALAERRAEITRSTRARIPRRRTVAWATVLEQLSPWLGRQDHPASRLAEATGVPGGTCSRLLRHGPGTITADLAGRLLVVVDVELEEAA